MWPANADAWSGSKSLSKSFHFSLFYSFIRFFVLFPFYSEDIFAIVAGTYHVGLQCTSCGPLKSGLLEAKLAKIFRVQAMALAEDLICPQKIMS